MKKAIYKYGQILALLAVLALFAFYIKDNPAVFRQVFALKPGGLALIASLTLLNITVNAYLAKSLLKFLGFRADLLLVFKINALGLMLNLILIKGGTLAKAYYLREFIGLTMKKYLALIALSALVSLLAALIALVAFGWPLLAVLIIILVVVAAQAKINFKNKGALAKSWLIACLSLLILAFKLWLIYRLAFSALPFSSALLIAAVGALSQFIALTPGALGIREGLMAAAAGLIGENIAAMAAVAALDRAVHTIIIFGLGSFSYFSLKRAKNGSPARTKSRPS